MTSRATRGSAAVALRAMPESAEKYRDRVRRELARQRPTIALLAAQVANASVGPDPEAALVYLAELRESCDEVLAKFRG